MDTAQKKKEKRIVAKNKENITDQTISVRLTGFEVLILNRLGGPSEFLRAQIHEKAGDKFKLIQQKQAILDRIETDQKQVKEIDKLLLEFEKKAEEEKQRLADENKAKSKPGIEVRKSMTVDAWVMKWKPQFLQKLNKNGGLHEIEYKSIFDKIGLKSKEEADAWIREN